MKQVQVIQINSTTIKNIISIAKSNFNLDCFLLVYRKYRYSNKSWKWNLGTLNPNLLSIIHSLVRDEFKWWIQKWMTEKEHNADKNKSSSEGLAWTCQSNERFSQSFKYLCLLFNYKLIPGRSYFKLRAKSKESQILRHEWNNCITRQNDDENSELFKEF